MDLISVLNNEYLLVSLAIFTTIYASMNRLQLPPYIVKLFKNDIFRILFLSLLLVVNFHKAPHVALVVAIVFIITLNYISHEEARENFTLLETFRSNVKTSKGKQFKKYQSNI